MKNIFLSLVFTFFSIFTFSQVWEDQLLEQNSSPSIAEKIAAFEAFRAKVPYTKGNGYKPYARNMDFVQQRVNGNSPFPSAKLYLEWKKEVEKYKYQKNSSSSNWQALGPIDVPIILSNGKKRGNGRVNCIAFDPVDPDIIWVGAPAGGLWKTIDGGSNWTTTTDNLPVIGVSSIAIDPNNSQIIYIATGDAHASDTYSVGIMKSTDGGNTWNTTGLSYTANQGKIVNKIIINPNASDSLFAVTNFNIMLSTDGGANWANVGPIGRWRDIEFKPNNPSVLYAAKQSSGGSNVYRSTDGGAQWSVISNGVASNGKYRPLIAVTPDNPEVIYALYSASDYGFHGVYKSSNGGDSWTLQSNTPNILGRETDGSGSGGQSWYDLSFAVSTNEENHLYVGGINLWESVDGGQSWDINASSGSSSNYSYMHVDQHAVEFNPINHIAYAGNDGGFYKYMDNLNKWVDISDGLEISQFYRLGLSSSNPDRLVAGAQDNGTEMLTNGTWDAIRGADGMECAIDAFDEDIIYSTSQYGGLRKSYDGGNNWSNIKPVNYEGGWVTPYKIHPQNNDLIVAGYDEVYLSNTAGATWDSISYNVSNGQSIKTIALAPSDENYIYVATYTKFMVTKDGGANWTAITSLPNINISDVTVDANNAEKLWVTFSGYSGNNKVYQSVDGGDNWTNITGSNLPNLPANCIVFQDYANEDLYIGTDVGVYHKDNTMTEWMPFMTGLPNVIINELEIHYGAGKIRAATYGRGIWESDLNTISSVENLDFNAFNIYPNPAKDQITISTTIANSKKLEIALYTLTGQLVIKTTRSTINTSGLKSGCYIVEVNADGYFSREKLIIE